MKTFALIGAAGFIAPRHMKAIKETGNTLVCALDKHDNVGILDSYFSEAAFFTEIERFDRHLDKLKRNGRSLDYLSICTPNYLHDAHVRFGLKHGAHAICEKPLVLNPRNLVGLREVEKDYQRKIFTILQLRLHESIIKLKEEVNASKAKHYDVTLTYITSRGNWYYASWKGEGAKSGGIACNIGIHFFDMLLWIFGEVKTNEVHVNTFDRAAGHLELEKASVKWFLSIDYNTIPESTRTKGKRYHRSMLVNGIEIDFSDGFTDLHTTSYQHILGGKGFGVDDAAPSVELASEIVQKPLAFDWENAHPLAKLPLRSHPFHL